MYEKNMTTRRDDMSAEQQLTKFLDIYLYNKISPDYKFVTRITDKAQQLQGIDVMLGCNNGDSIYIDEKAQLHYLDKCLDTFAFEISFVGVDETVRKGWLYNHDLKTDTYMLIWPIETIYHNKIISLDSSKRKDKVRELLKTIKYDDFEKLECFFIKKDAIKKFLADNGWDEQKVLNKACEIREKKLLGKTPLTGIYSFYFYFTPVSNYSEAPINIVIRKKFLYNLAYKRFLVTKDKLIKI